MKNSAKKTASFKSHDALKQLLLTHKETRGQIKKLLVQGRASEADNLFKRTLWQGHERKNLLLMLNLASKTKLPETSKQWLEEKISLKDYLDLQPRDRDTKVNLLVNIAEHNEDLFEQLCHNPTHDKYHFDILCASLKLKITTENQEKRLAQWETLLAPSLRELRQVPNLRFLLGVAIVAENKVGIEWLLGIKNRKDLNLDIGTANSDFDFIHGGLRNIMVRQIKASQLVVALAGLPPEKIEWQKIARLPSLKSPEIAGEAKAMLEKIKLQTTVPNAVEVDVEFHNLPAMAKRL